MTQNATECLGSIRLCVARFSRLNADGTFKGGANNHVVTDNVQSIEFTPNISSGQEIEVMGGCDCIDLFYRGYDKLRYFELSFTLTRLNPALMELLLGASLISDTSTSPVPIGDIWANQLQCGAATQPPVAVEVWTDAWTGDAQANAPHRYIRWVFPMSFWQLDASTLGGTEFFNPSFTGYTRSNSNFTNPYGDYPAGVPSALGAGAYFYDTTRPTAVCGYSTTST